MPILITTFRILRNTLQHLLRNPWHALAAVLVMALTFFVASIFVVAAVSSNAILHYLENKPRIYAFFKDSTPESYILQLKKQLEESGKTSQIKYISKNEALEIYRRQNVAEPALLEFVTADILPATLEISSAKPEDLTELARILANDVQIEKVIYQKDVIDALLVLTRRLRIIGLSLISFLTVVSVLIVLVVISMNIATFGKEVEIMRLVGADSWYIRWPFILDGAIVGLVSAFLSALTLFLLRPAITQTLKDFSPELNLYPVSSSFLLSLFLIQVIVGVVLGALGSLVAIGRQLKT